MLIFTALSSCRGGRVGSDGACGASGEGVAGSESRKFAVASEDNWLRDWKDAIRGAVLAKRSGWATSEDRLEALMSTRRNEGTGDPIWSDRMEG